jgi:hypothetical protein
MGKWIEVEHDLYLPDWMMRLKAKERVAKMMAFQAPRALSTSEQRLAEMKGNDLVPGAYIVPPGRGQRDALAIISNGEMTADAVRDLEGKVRWGGYGQKIYHKTDGLSKDQWKRTVLNFCDWLQQSSTAQAKGKFQIGVH